jgi:2-oxoglutarate/2-oxoacid ferredoxin oxidoreductase subunit alpha
MNPKTEVTIWIGGEAGEGIASAGDVLLKTAARMGLGAFAHNSYQSVIRGGHVLLQTRIGAHPVLSQGDSWDFLIALNQQSIDLHVPTARSGAGVLFNQDKVKALVTPTGTRMYGVPVAELTAALPKNPVMQNTVLLGALAEMLAFPWELFESTIRSQFAKKKTDTTDINVTAARNGWDFAERHFPAASNIRLDGDGKQRMMITGNQAIGLGAVAGGCKFYAAYPMTPASSVMHWLAPRAPKFGMLMKQTEDEIAAMNMAIGAGYAGVRAMVGTSGGGFALMTEAVGMAGMAEIPVVAVVAQRGGPSTGLPTKTEQGDLFQVLGASQGEYPKAVIAPLDVVDAYYATIECLNLAEQFQMPVILLSDLYLSEHTEVADPDGFHPHIPIERGEMVAQAHEGYARYLDTASGISPRTVPGTPGGMYTSTTDEHDEHAVLASDVFASPSVRKKMMEKRMRKMEGVGKATAAKAYIFEESAHAELTLVGWGSTYRLLCEARQQMIDAGHPVNLLQFRTMWPFPAEATLPLLQTTKRAVCIENNFSGMLARLIRQETGFLAPCAIRKYDGEPFTPEQLVAALQNCLRPDAPALQTLVSSELDIPVVLK